MRETAETRAWDYLSRHRGKEICDDCLGTRAGLGNRRAAWRATSILGKKTGFERSKKDCPLCQRSRMVIKAV